MSGAFRRFFAPRDGAPPERPSLPAGLRIYAVGDIHGRYDLLEAIATRIRGDLAAAPPERSIEIFLGDYVDRGPRSREVLDWLTSAPPLADERLCLLGNHEDMLLQVLEDPEATLGWLQNGGLATMQSYDALRPEQLTELTLGELHAAFLAAFPAEHRAFVRGLPRLKRFGSYLFVHAGLRPGRAIEDQDADDLVWIRDPFLLSAADFGACVVHGHTPAEAPEIRPNRINIDTGAFFTGRLTCLVLEGKDRRFLQTPPD